MSTMLNMRDLDRRLGLPAGSANYLRRRGVIVATRRGMRTWVVREAELEAVREAVEGYRGLGLSWPTIEETAEQLGITPSTVYTLVGEGKLVSVVTGGGRHRVDPNSIQEYRERRALASRRRK